jgi:hypothetical protein
LFLDDEAEARADFKVVSAKNCESGKYAARLVGRVNTICDDPGVVALPHVAILSAQELQGESDPSDSESEDEDESEEEDSASQTQEEDGGSQKEDDDDDMSDEEELCYAQTDSLRAVLGNPKLTHRFVRAKIRQFAAADELETGLHCVKLLKDANSEKMFMPGAMETVRGAGTSGIVASTDALDMNSGMKYVVSYCAAHQPS